MSGALAGAIGRKKVILISNIFVIVGWAFIGFSDGDFALIMIGRNIHGVVLLASLSQVYLAEVPDANRRWSLLRSALISAQTCTQSKKTKNWAVELVKRLIQ